MSAKENTALNTFMHCPNHTEQPGSFSYRANSYLITVSDVGTPGVRLTQVENPMKKILLFEVHTTNWWPRVASLGAGVGKAPFNPPYTTPTHGNLWNHLFADGHVASTKVALKDGPTYWYAH